MPGILVQTIVLNAVYSGMGLSTDLEKGLFDQFRSLPVWSLAPFAGLMVGDVLRHAIAGSIILAIGVILGFRPQAGIVGVLASLVLLVAIGFAMGWIFIALGLVIRTPMTLMTMSFTFLMPLVFASNIMVEPSNMPGWLRTFVGVNPVSLVRSAMRGLMAGTATIRQIGLALVLPVVSPVVSTMVLALVLPVVSRVVSPVVLAMVTLWLYRRWCWRR